MEKDTDLPNNLKHYVSFENLITILTNKALHLGDTKNWEDKNDAASVQAYARHNSVQVGVLCLTMGDESIHHWNTFAKGPTGCRIDFINSTFQKAIKSCPDIMYNKMTYLKRDFDITKFKNTDYPFLKRKAYNCEDEYRIVWTGKGKPNPIPIEGLIKRITISPYIQDHALKVIRKLLDETYGIKEVCKSAILDDSHWTGKFIEKENKKSKK